MRRALGLGVLVLLVPMLQGALNPFLPRFLRPDLPLLVLLALSVCWRGHASGLLLVATCGFVVDLFSGSLLGVHALLAVAVFGAARLLSVHVNLLGPLPQMFYVAVLTVLHALGVAALTSFFTPAAPTLFRPGELASHAVVNAVLAPLASAAVAWVVAWSGGEETSRRTLRLAARRWAS